MSGEAPRLILLPGLGADARMFDAQRAVFPGLVVPPWLSPEPAESLPSFAGRMAAACDVRPPFFLGGASFGGMVALEMARHLAPEAVFLLGSCTSGDAIPAYARILGTISGSMPLQAFHTPPAITALLSRKFGRLSIEEREVFHQMMLATPPEFIKWGCSAILGWDPPSLPTVRIHQIHGSADQVIPRRCVTPEEVVPGGGHLVNMTHAAAVNAFIRDRMMPSPT